MERSEVSLQELRVFQAVRNAGGWITAAAAAEQAQVAPRTARSHCLRLVNAGIFDQAEVFPGHRYRLSKQASKRNKAQMLRLAQAEEIFGPLA
jgi:DNA-binding IclR family transcriptional regulator